MLLLLKILQVKTKIVDGILRSPIHTNCNAPEIVEWGIFGKSVQIAAVNRKRRRQPQTAAHKLKVLQFRISVHL